MVTIDEKFRQVEEEFEEVEFVNTTFGNSPDGEQVI